MRPLPPVPNDELNATRLRDYLRRLIVGIEETFRTVMVPTEAVEAIYLASPDRKIYKVTVDNAGTLTTTLVQG